MALQNRIALDVVVDDACELVVVRREKRVPLLQLKNFVLVQGALENLARLLDLSLDH